MIHHRHYHRHRNYHLHHRRRCHQHPSTATTTTTTISIILFVYFNPKPHKALQEIMHFQWHSDMFYKRTSGTGFQWQRPQILSLSLYTNFRLQYRTDNKEIEV
jgi:hypothetical protein